MNGLSCGEEIMTIRSAVLIPCQRVTDGQTDGQTDRRPAYIYYVLQHSMTHVKIRDQTVGTGNVDWTLQPAGGIESGASSPDSGWKRGGLECPSLWI